MRTQKSSTDKVICFICDQPIILFGGLLLVGLLIIKYLSGFSAPIAITTLSPTITSTIIFTHTPVPVVETSIAASVTKTPTATPIPTKPVYIFAAIPVSYSGSSVEFENFARDGIMEFVQSSGMSTYFDHEIIIGSENYDLDVASDTLLEDVYSIAVMDYPADRYIAISDQIISNDILGYSYGENSPVVFSSNIAIQTIAHELGHTFGLCDEYEFRAWTMQNSDIPTGCPNPFPPEDMCSHEDGVICDGNPSADGNPSMMGPYIGEYEYQFNESSYGHLQEVFEGMVK